MVQPVQRRVKKHHFAGRKGMDGAGWSTDGVEGSQPAPNSSTCRLVSGAQTDSFEQQRFALSQLPRPESYQGVMG